MAFKEKMKCIACGGPAWLSTHDSRLFGGTLAIKGAPMYKCKKCGEEFATSEMVDAGLELAKGAFAQFNFERQVISTGGSLGITFPGDLSKHYKLKKGSMIRLVPKSKNEITLFTQ